MKKILIILTLITVCHLNISCRHYHYKHTKKELKSVIMPVNGSNTHGWVRIQLDKNNHGSVIVKAKIKGLQPNSKHGFHIHQYGDCSDNGRYAGKHLNPSQKQHGSPDMLDNKHMGDLGNLKVDMNGVAVYEKRIPMCLKKAIGRAIIIHAKTDDLKSQPSGNAGAYIGCGILGRVQPSDLH